MTAGYLDLGGSICRCMRRSTTSSTQPKIWEATKTFFQAVFGWSFEDYGGDYTAFSGEGLDGGFFKSELVSRADDGSALLIFTASVLKTRSLKLRAQGAKLSGRFSRFPAADGFTS